MTTKHTATARKKRYEKKRNFAATPEPSWKSRSAKNPPPAGRQFVIQKHDARRLHYDLRLEIEGALASWAVPKGFPAKHGEKHLAIKVEDHPLDYGEFEGAIPAGNYGAGTVMLWDRGLYEIVESDPAAAVAKGHLTIVFAGEKLTGSWTLVRTRPQNGKESWLLLKGKENDWQILPEEDDRSVASNRSLAEIADDAKTEKRIRNTVEDLPVAAPAFVSPMKPHLTEHLPHDGNWTYEIKFDGYRVLAVKQREETRLFSRNRIDVSENFTEIRDTIAALPINELVIDGEIVALLETGIASFQLLQNHARSGAGNGKPLFYYAFDLLNLDGHDTTGLPLSARKSLLSRIFTAVRDPLRFSAGIDTDPEIFLKQARKLGLEGLIAKDSNSRYQSGRRSRSWLKIKLHRQQEFVIGGYTKPKGSRSHFGAILIGVYRGKKLHFVSRVGTGFTEKSLQEAYEKFQPLRTETCPFANLPSPRKSSYGGGITASEMKSCTWLKPKLVCEIRFSDWTDDDSVRHPVFLGFRDDKPALQVHREQPI